jgi:hypothetical protein
MNAELNARRRQAGAALAYFGGWTRGDLTTGNWQEWAMRLATELRSLIAGIDDIGGPEVNTTEYFIIITLSLSFGQGAQVCSFPVNANVAPGTTSRELYEQVRQSVADKAGAQWAEAVVQFYSAVPNALGGHPAAQNGDAK